MSNMPSSFTTFSDSLSWAMLRFDVPGMGTPTADDDGADAGAACVAGHGVWVAQSFQLVTFHQQQLKPDRPFTLATPAQFTPNALDTDEWARAVKEMGGKYAVLNVKDESGFLLMDAEECGYDYTVRQSPVWSAVGASLVTLVGIGD